MIDPVTGALLVGGVASYLGNQQSGKAQADAIQRANDIIQSVPLPVLKEYYPELYKQVAALNPELETSVSLGQSQMSGIATDPALRQAQINALLKLQEVGDQGGMTATDRARMAQIQSDINTNLKGQQGAIQQNLAARGMSGGMSELVARNLSAQEAANRQAQQGLDVKAQAEQRALQAIMQSGQLGGQISAQDFAQQEAKARAADQIAQWNAQNLQNVQSRNVGAKNQAQQFNAEAAQNVAGQNVGLRNQAQQYNLGLPQQQYQNQLARATGQAQGISNLAQQQAQNQQMQNQLIGGLLQTGAAYYGSKNKTSKIPGEV